MTTTHIVIAKRPVPGRVKTRLVPPLSYEQAALLAGAALADTLATVGNAPGGRKILAFDGAVSGWLPAGWQHAAQCGGGLDRRLAAAFGAAGAGRPALLVGMDTPQLHRDHLAAFDPSRYDACLGRAVDGGYWAIGFVDPSVAADAILDVPMSTGHTADDQLARLASLGLRVQLLDELVDVDTIEDAHTVAALAPGSTFARAVAGLDLTTAQAG